jgi:spore coat polysaccharide biosynthesis protein SpsF
MQVNAVIQARMGSTRLPGKVLRELTGTPVLGWVIRALRSATQVDAIVVATSSSPPDNPVEAYARSLDIACVRGSEHDVLGRFLTALDEAPADAVVRITADCPLVDPALVDQVIAAWRTDPRWDYVSTTLLRTLPRGLDVELIRAETLRELDTLAAGPHREHVTSLVYTEPRHRRLLGLTVAPPADDLRVTLDTEDDWALLCEIGSAFGDGIIDWRSLVDYLRGRPDLVAINAGVIQRPVLS